LLLSSNDYIKLASIYVYEYLLTSVTIDYCWLLPIVIDSFLLDSVTQEGKLLIVINC